MISEVLHFHVFCGLGGAATGMNDGEARVGNLEARFRCLGGVDVVPAAVRDFERLSGVRGTVLDLFDREQYCDFHGAPPPASWREAGPEDLRRAAGGEYPDIVFTSPPCKGFSGLLSEKRSAASRYQALNRLTIRGVMLLLTAWEDDPPAFVLLENVPRIAQRGRHLVDQITALLRAHGYSVAETTHDCGELGGLAQHRKRFLMAARHRAKVPPFLYHPPSRRVRGVGEVLGAFPLPGHPAAGPMHELPRLQWRTWLRLALVEAGSDWRSLERLRVVDGELADFALAPAAEYFSGPYGVCPWDAPARRVTGESRPSNGQFAVADPRVVTGWQGKGKGRVTGWEEPSGVVIAAAGTGQGACAIADPRTGYRGEYGQYGVRRWTEPSGTVAGGTHPGQGCYAIADPRLPHQEVDRRHRNLWRVVPWPAPAGTIIGASRPGSGALSVADPRLACGAGDRERRRFNNVYRVVGWPEPAQAVTGGGGPSAGAQGIADPRLACKRDDGGDWQGAGARHYGVLPWTDPGAAVTAAACHDNGAFSVADPRPPAPGDHVEAVILALDGTWHRPFSTLELAALQGLVTADEQLELDGTSHSAWRERIGNAVPAPTAAAIASVMGRALLLARTGERFALGSTPVWARRLALAVAVDTPQDFVQ